MIIITHHIIMTCFYIKCNFGSSSGSIARLSTHPPLHVCFLGNVLPLLCVLMPPIIFQRRWRIKMYAGSTAIAMSLCQSQKERMHVSHVAPNINTFTRTQVMHVVIDRIACTQNVLETSLHLCANTSQIGSRNSKILV